MEKQARVVLYSALIIFLLPAMMFSFVSIYSVRDSIANDPEEAYVEIMSIAAYLSATGIGIAAGGQTIPVALHEHDVISADACFILTTAIGFGGHFAAYFWLGQVWSLIDPYSVLYVFVWHVLYLSYAYAAYVKSKWMK